MNADFGDRRIGADVRFVEEAEDLGPKASSVYLVGKHHITGQGAYVAKPRQPYLSRQLLLQFLQCLQCGVEVVLVNPGTRRLDFGPVIA